MSTRDEIIKEAVRHGRVNASGWVRIDCPFCGDTRGSFGFNTATGGFVCNRTAACGIKGRVGGHVTIPDREPARPSGSFYSPDFVPLWTARAEQSVGCSAAINYVRARGLDADDVYFAKIHYALTGKYAGRIIIPHADARGSWWGFTARRTYEDDSPKVLYPAGMPRRLYNDQALDEATERPLLAVEGCLDAVKYLPDVVACLGKPTEEHGDRFMTSLRPLVFALDGDAWQEGKMWAMRLTLHGKNAAAVRLPPASDPLTVDPGWLRAEARKQLAFVLAARERMPP